MREYSPQEIAYYEGEGDKVANELRSKYPSSFYWGKLTMVRYPDMSDPKGVFDVRQGNAKFEIAHYLMFKGITAESLLQTIENSISQDPKNSARN